MTSFAEQLLIVSSLPDKINRMRNKKHGEVYIINNPAWSDWYKIGKAVDSRNRLIGYQTTSPFRDFCLLYTILVYNRHRGEKIAHRIAEKLCEERNNEWFHIKDIDVAKDKIKNTLDKKGMTAYG